MQKLAGFLQKHIVNSHMREKRKCAKENEDGHLAILALYA